MHSHFSAYIKLIGQGKKSGQTLSLEQARDAMNSILAGEAEPEQLGAFLMLLRYREETIEELAGFLQACRAFNHQDFKYLIQPDLDLGCYAGKRRHLPWLVLAVLVLVQNGYKVFLHGTAESESTRLYLHQVWKAFGWTVASDIQEANEQLHQSSFCYMDLASFNPALHRLIQLRRMLGLRSCANSLARMLNPSRSQHSVQGVFHRHFDTKHVQVASLLRENSVYCFRGDAGEIEINPEREFDLISCQQGKVDSDHFPALLDKCQVKPKSLDPLYLKAVWCGGNDVYGEASVVGTLSVLLSILNGITPSSALDLASDLWNGRDKQWAFLNRAVEIPDRLAIIG